VTSGASRASASDIDGVEGREVVLQPPDPGQYRPDRIARDRHLFEVVDGLATSLFDELAPQDHAPERLDDLEIQNVWSMEAIPRESCLEPDSRAAPKDELDDGRGVDDDQRASRWRRMMAAADSPPRTIEQVSLNR
jgi:hypothetical protein